MEAGSPASENGFSIECYSSGRVETDSFSNVLCSFIHSKFRASGNHYSNKGEAISCTVTSLLLLETIFYAYIYSLVETVFFYL